MERAQQNPPRQSQARTPAANVPQPDLSEEVLPADSAPAALSPSSVIQLQRIVGNRATLRLLGRDRPPTPVTQKASTSDAQPIMLGRTGLTESQAALLESVDYSERTSLADDEGNLYEPYASNIRRTFYPSGYWTTTHAWKDAQLDGPLQDPDHPRKFICPDCGESVNKKNATIDHKTPVSSHWNSVGHDQVQDERAEWFNDTGNHEILCRSCNSSKGGIPYIPIVGPHFYGPPNLENRYASE